jgi:putative mRNA 3-end processing factor
MEELSEIVYDHGTHVLGTILWMDPTLGRDLAFLSHAGRISKTHYRKVICSGMTSEIVTRAGTGRKAFTPLTSPYGRPFSIGSLRITLYDAGFAPGSAQLFVESKKGNILYSGDIGLTDNQSVVPPEKVDILIISAPLAHPNIEVPPIPQMQEATTAFVRSCLRDGFFPVIACPPLGTAQDVMKLLHDEGVSMEVHASIDATNQVLRNQGMDVPKAQLFDRRRKHESAIIWPLHLLDSPVLAQLQKVRTLALTGTATVQALRRTIKADLALPWTRHPSFAQTLQFVRAVNPQAVYTVFGFEKELAAALQEAGFNARDLTAGKQLRLAL